MRCFEKMFRFGRRCLDRVRPCRRIDKTAGKPLEEFYAGVLTCCGAAVPANRLHELGTSPSARNIIQQIFQIHFPIVENHRVEFTDGECQVSERYMARVAAAYARNCSYDLKESPLWAHIDSLRSEIHDALLKNDTEVLKSFMSDPFPTKFFYGFEVCGESLRERPTYQATQRSYLAAFYVSTLLRLAEYLGAVRVENPEHYHAGLPLRQPVDDIVDAIARLLPFPLDFPNPFPNMPGVKTRKGVFTSRTIQGLYQASVVASYPHAKVLEIGAGLGWGAYYAARFGVKDYTIIDIPLSAAASSLFLGTTLGENFVSLYGENERKTVRILPPDAFPASETFDVILNVDSMTEMDKNIALDYWKKIKQTTRHFISMNHEKNAFSVHDLIVNDADVKRYHRYPNWLRKSYVDEIVEFK